MSIKLRTIRTTSRSASVKRSDVTSAARAVIVRRQSTAERFQERKSTDKRSSASARK